MLFTKTVWDTQKDADEFYGSMWETFKKIKPDGATWSGGERFFSLKETGNTVYFIASTDRKALDAAGTQAK